MSQFWKLIIIKLDIFRSNKKFFLYLLVINFDQNFALKSDFLFTDTENFKIIGFLMWIIAYFFFLSKYEIQKFWFFESY